jgi:SPP1 gp7 family putative phage head morphogenesis protein
VSTPASLYRNAIDLNRYSNSVAKQLVVSYNDIIIDAVNQLRTIDDLAAPVKAARLRAILAQLKDSLGTWSDASVATMSSELQGLALLQSEFVEDQLRRALPAGARSAVNTVEISPQFAQSVVTTDPTQLNVVTLSDDLFAAVQGAPQTFSLTAAKGATITLPNGQVVQKAFRGIAADQAERFSQVVRNGLLTGEPTPAIAKRLIGNLQLGEAGSVRQLAQKGGELTQATDNQVMTLVRTSVNQVANAASQQVYEANQDITQKYLYVATLDSRTSSICRALDGREFEYGKGPTPPQHFNCLPGDALVAPSGRIAAVYRRRYEGFLCVIKTADGHIVRVTPNHPVLTLTGWQPAQSIKVGDQVFSRSIVPSELIKDCQESNAVTTAEDVFSSFRKSSTVSAMEVPTTAPDFHGDALSGSPRVDLAKQVAVVLADRELLLTVNPGLLKALLDFSFQGSNFAATSSSHFELSSLSIGTPALSDMSSSSKGFAFSRGSTTHSGRLLLAPVSKAAPRFQNDALYGTWRDVELLGNSANADTVVVSGNDQVNVTWVGREPFSGHVYNFETESGTYWADGILTHNCRSTTVPVIDYNALGFDPPPPGKRASMDGPVPADLSYGQWLAKQDATTKAEVLGKEKVPYFNMLVEKYGGKDAIAKLVRDDGSELTLEQLRRRYGAAGS